MDSSVCIVDAFQPCLQLVPYIPSSINNLKHGEPQVGMLFPNVDYDRDMEKWKLVKCFWTLKFGRRKKSHTFASGTLTETVGVSL